MRENRLLTAGDAPVEEKGPPEKYDFLHTCVGGLCDRKDALSKSGTPFLITTPRLGSPIQAFTRRTVQTSQRQDDRGGRNASMVQCIGVMEDFDKSPQQYHENDI